MPDRHAHPFLLRPASAATYQSALCAYRRRLCARMGCPKDIAAPSHKLARLVYFMLTKGFGFAEAGQDDHERMLQNLTKYAHHLDSELPAPPATLSTA